MGTVIYFAEPAIAYSTYQVTCPLVDDNDLALTPTSAKWTLTKADGSIVNGRENVAITGGNLVSSLVLPLLNGADLPIPDGINCDHLYVTVYATGDVDGMDDAPFKREYGFKVTR